MDWIHLTETLQEYSIALEDATKANMPGWELKNDISFQVDIQGTEYQITFKAPEYWKYVNDGRGPGKMPPISAIESWINRVKLVPRATKDGKVPTVPQLAFLIARKIGREGTEATKFLDRAVESVNWEDRLIDAIVLDISEELETFLSPLSGTLAL